MQNLIKLEKREFRRSMKHLIASISQTEKERQSAVVQKYFIENCKPFKNAKTIAIYLAQKDQEIDTTHIIETILTQHNSKNLFIPFIHFNKTVSNQMHFFKLESIRAFHEDLCDKNRYKIKQFRSVDNLEELKPGQADLVIVPGLAFSRSDSGYSRLGRGKGYYDRFLTSNKSCHTISLAFNEQLTPNEHINKVVPTDLLDVTLTSLICENLIN
jgi:5-formyltetrahydrofolate cyclo-ligase